MNVETGVVVRTVGVAPSTGTLIETDRWVPLMMEWDSVISDAPLYLFIREPADGFVELKIDPDTGALIGFVIIDLPQEDGRGRTLHGVPAKAGTPVVDRDMWPCKVTPDYREPAKRNVDMSLSLASSVDDNCLTVWIGEGQPEANLTTEDVAVTIGRDGALLAISVPWPKESAELWPLSPKGSTHGQGD
ncbi:MULTISPECIES: hypothetical protein [Actinomyces]|uniref:Uncharacterized protein n=1 Tax=Actinomyces respiraculi TaxID=2744574 RepID=A0A7T0LLL8_9ACTO|nr:MULTISPECIES: hypothetical protein [Actinomyces]QPL06037.1 hypothetical protein ID810_03580 [Actinomyces respiraculi]